MSENKVFAVWHIAMPYSKYMFKGKDAAAVRRDASYILDVHPQNVEVRLAFMREQLRDLITGKLVTINHHGELLEEADNEKT